MSVIVSVAIAGFVVGGAADRLLYRMLGAPDAIGRLEVRFDEFLDAHSEAHREHERWSEQIARGLIATDDSLERRVGKLERETPDRLFVLQRQQCLILRRLNIESIDCPTTERAGPR